MTRRPRAPATAASRAALTAFLRECRGRIAPADVGLARPCAQRSAGLTRGQTARLAGISSGWYTLVESGRASGVSTRCVEAIAHALRLDRAECTRLAELVALVYGERRTGARARKIPDAGPPDCR